MRTTIRLDDDLLREAEALAARTGRTLNAVIEDAVRALLAQTRGASTRPRIQLPTVGGRGLLPGVNLDDTKALLDLTEGPG